MGKITLFNTKIPFVLAIGEVAMESGGFLTDGLFTRAIREFGLNEELAMDLMVNNESYEFTRVLKGWVVNLKGD